MFTYLAALLAQKQSWMQLLSCERRYPMNLFRNEAGFYKRIATRVAAGCFVLKCLFKYRVLPSIHSPNALVTCYASIQLLNPLMRNPMLKFISRSLTRNTKLRKGQRKCLEKIRSHQEDLKKLRIPDCGKTNPNTLVSDLIEFRFQARLVAANSCVPPRLVWSCVPIQLKPIPIH